MAASLAVEEENVIRRRLLTGASSSKEPPFKKLTKRFLEFCKELESGTEERAQVNLEVLLSDVANFEYMGRKLGLQDEANRREQQSYVEKQGRLLDAIEQAKQDIENRKRELDEARVVRQHKEEYEALRRQAMKQPKRATTRANIARLEQDIEAIKADDLRVDQLHERRRRQFVLLLHAAEELQRTITEEELEGLEEGQAAEPMQT